MLYDGLVIADLYDRFCYDIGVGLRIPPSDEPTFYFNINAYIVSTYSKICSFC